MGLGPEPWVVDDAGSPKQGTYSVGVARQYSGTLGHIADCQVAVRPHHATAAASPPIAWALCLHEEWTQHPARCAAASVPTAVRDPPTWRLTLDLIDRARRWGLADQRGIADAGYGTIAEFRAGLRERRVPHVVGVESGTGVSARRPAAPPRRRYGATPDSRMLTTPRVASSRARTPTGRVRWYAPCPHARP